METALKLGPASHGRPVSLDDFEHSETEDGYQYELIDGRLYVSPVPNLPENRVAEWLSFQLKLYARDYTAIINYVSGAGRMFVPGRKGITTPQPDVTAYHDFPLDRDYRDVRWQDVSPLVVAEVLSLDDPDKDLVRNVELYLQVPTIKEYWLFDNRDTAEHPFLRVHRRHGKRWRLFDYRIGDTYTTRLLPGFALVLDPRR